MCGRFTLTAPSSIIEKAFGLSGVPDLPPRYNIAPTQTVAAVRADAAGQPSFTSLRWGLVPAWAEDPAIGARMINARRETVHEKPSFRTVFRRQRCLVLADGYYEWRKTADGKQPYLIRTADGKPFAFAGLWERRARPGEDIIESCAIITTRPTAGLREIHDRMPVILTAHDYPQWLDPKFSNVEVLRGLLEPFTDQALIASEVSTWVNDVRHDDPRCLQALD